MSSLRLELLACCLPRTLTAPKERVRATMATKRKFSVTASEDGADNEGSRPEPPRVLSLEDEIEKALRDTLEQKGGRDAAAATVPSLSDTERDTVIKKVTKSECILRQYTSIEADEYQSTTAPS